MLPSLLCLSLSLLPADDAPTLEVGDSSVRPTRLEEHAATWTQAAVGTAGELTPGGEIREETARVRKGGKQIILRRQVMQPPNQPFQQVTIHELDAKTLAPLSIESRIENLPEGAGLPPGVPLRVKSTWDGADYTISREFSDGSVEESQGSLDKPRFDLGVAGLVIAALPLKEDYVAHLPIASIGPGRNPGQDWTLVARVVEEFDYDLGGGKSVQAWLVETDWLDPLTGENTSPGGEESSGGAYTVVSRPKGGLPHVLRYANESVVIDLARPE